MTRRAVVSATRAFPVTARAPTGVDASAQVWTASGVAMACLAGVLGCGSAATKMLPLRAEVVPRTILDCERAFPNPPFEATHVIEASIPFSDDASLLGVVVAEKPGQGFRTVLMTQEGIVLFDAKRKGDAIETVRALPPTDREGFGRSMTDDIRLILLRPDEAKLEVGQTESGIRVCRWTSGEEQTEVQLTGPNEASVTRLRRGSVVRRAWFRDIDGDGFARDIRLESTSLISYQLHLTLLDVGSKSDAIVKADMPSAPRQP